MQSQNQMSTTYIQNKDVLLVGGSGGIGTALRTTLEEANCNVISINRSVCDISSKKQIDDLFVNIKNVDVLINNAAINHAKKIDDVSFEEWENVLRVNMTGLFYVTKKSIPLMKPGSKIVNVSSIAGRHKSLVSGVHYTASKSGLIGFTRQLAHELGPKGINVNCVCPSQTRTPMLERSMNEDEIKKLSDQIPLRRIANVEEIVKPILFLCSQDSSYIHGACIDINGGQF